MAILVGTASWTDKTLLESGWYPSDAKTAEARLAYYAERFPLVEVDSTYYGLPSERNAVLWAERTPKNFTFNVKAFSLMTGHPTRIAALPKDVRDAAPEDAKTVRPGDLPASVVDHVWEIFRSALMPLHSAGKLGCILMQFPEWFLPKDSNRERILDAASRLPDYRIAVEFRRGDWLQGAEGERTIAFLTKHKLPLVCLDMPQGFASSVAPVTAVTARDLAILRLHGHNKETWKKRGITAAERFNYLYSQKELSGLVPRVRALEEKARETHVVFNNCYRDKGVINATQLSGLLGLE
ncbi:MAG: DUF72 domain-containing protein [Actinomycetota bacterium]|nr:DUF72 domain-containing protein [Actinomycetota bacterium]